MVSFYVLKEVSSKVIRTAPKLNVKGTSVSRQTISKAGINKNKRKITSAQVIGLPSLTDLF